MFNMGTITINVDDETEESFRKAVRHEKGVGKGKLGEAVKEALDIWVYEKKQREIAERQIKLMEKGFNMGKIGKWTREELHDRSI